MEYLKNIWSMKHAKRKTVGRIQLIGFFLFIVYFEPSSFSVLSSEIDTLFRISRWFVSLSIIVWYISSRRKIDAIVALTSLYFFIIFLSTVINRHSVSTCLQNILTYTAAVALCHILMDHSEHTFINAICPIVNSLIYANLLSIALWPRGIFENYSSSDSLIFSTTENWLLGYDNVFIVYIIPALVFSIKRYNQTKKYTKDKLALAGIFSVSLITVFIRFPATSVVCLTIFTLACLVAWTSSKNNIDWKRIVNGKSIILSNVLIFIFLVIVQNYSVFSFLIENILHKNMTFSSRTTIWNKSLEAICEKPILGYGAEKMWDTVRRLGHISTHNHYLWVLYLGGILALIIFLLMLICALKSVDLAKSQRDRIVNGAALFVILLMWQLEAITVYSLFILISYFSFDSLKTRRRYTG